MRAHSVAVGEMQSIKLVQSGTAICQISVRSVFMGLSYSMNYISTIAQNIIT